MRYRRKGRRDVAEAPIIAALKAVGCTVVQLDGVPGLPDLLIARCTRMWLAEVKSASRADGRAKTRHAGTELTADQVRFRDQWKGPPIAIVRTVDDALRLVGAIGGEP